MHEIDDIVKLQPKPEVFFKSCFEFDFCNMVSILSFNSRSMSILLDGHEDLFMPRSALNRSAYQPVFYKNKIPKGKEGSNKYFYRSAIDTAVRNN
jgi:hypothetical protein